MFYPRAQQSLALAEEADAEICGTLRSLTAALQACFGIAIPAVTFRLQVVSNYLGTLSEGWRGKRRCDILCEVTIPKRWRCSGLHENRASCSVSSPTT